MVKNWSKGGHSLSLLWHEVVALYATGCRWRGAGLCHRADLRQRVTMATYGSSESKPRARALATA